MVWVTRTKHQTPNMGRRGRRRNYGDDGYGSSGDDSDGGNAHYDEPQVKLQWEIKVDEVEHDLIEYHDDLCENTDDRFHSFQSHEIIGLINYAYDNNNMEYVNENKYKDLVDTRYRNIEAFCRSVITMFNLDQHPYVRDNHQREDGTVPYGPYSEGKWFTLLFDNVLDWFISNGEYV